MATTSNWIRDAALKIVDPPYPDAYGEQEVATIIARHAPFKPDVAYIPVPRCDGCMHWARGVIPVISKPSHGGVCVNPELRAFTGEQTIETAEDFGCVQFEEKK